MGYSKNIITLERRLSLVQEILEQDEVVWETDNERLLAYQIREALAIAKTIGAAKYPELAEAARAFTVQETGQGKVIARRSSYHTSADLVNKSYGHKIKTTTEDLMEDFDAANPPTTVKLLRVSGADDLVDLATWLESQGFLLFWNAESNLATIKPFSNELKPLAFSAEDLVE